ncbi:MAG: NAD(P)H-binding protein [Chloroflexota bacterium]|nr:NAD(P)H-binding protein [Chloroflexota bacterium]
MTRVLVTGGTGYLGRHVVTILRENGHTPRIMSRSPRPASLLPGTEWVQAHLASGQGIEDAVQSCDVIVHTATSLSRARQSDVAGTQRLLEAARHAEVVHVVYISIVGIDRIPYAYYRDKLATEEVVKQSGNPWSILRTTQFHKLADRVMQAATKLPFIAIVPTDFKAQTVDAHEVAQRLCDLVASDPQGRAPDFGGPEVLTFGEMARTWLAFYKKRRLVIPLWLPGGFAQGFLRGDNTCPNEAVHGNTTWMQWLQNKHSVEASEGR